MTSLELEPPPRPGRSVVKRAAIAALLISLMTAGAVSAAVFLQVKDVVDIIRHGGRIDFQKDVITPAEAGKPETIMLLGTDKRAGNDPLQGGVRSDTIILARLDAHKDAITLMSIPRDLKVQIPARNGGFVTDKINAAYAMGGPNLVLKTVKQLLSSAGQPFKINHVVEINFHGFRTLVDYLGCTYVDIDERYFNNHGGPGGYATIDIQPGYQKLCGQDALDYVRYRHTDNDLVRGARQQDFIRQMLRQPGVQQKLNLSKRKTLARLASHYVRTDRALTDTQQLFSLLKLGLAVAAKPIQEVPFGEGQIQEDNSPAGDYLTVSQDAIDKTVNDFLNAKPLSRPRVKLTETPEEKKFAAKAKRHNKPAMVPGLEVARVEGENQAISAQRHIDFPFYYPELRASGAHYVGTVPRTYTIKDELGKPHDAYRIVVSLGVAGDYYGIQGMTWKYPPLLDGPHDTTTVNGRKLLIYYDGRRVRLVAWRTSKALYYVHNSLARTLSKRRMVAIAASLRRLGH
jgi:LCP family protein required for cell wall assembly